MRDVVDTSASKLRGKGWQISFLVAVSAYGPLTVLADANERPNLLTALFTVAVFTAGSVLTWIVLIRSGLDSLGSALAAGMFTLTAMNLGHFVALDDVDRVVVLLLPLVVALLAYRLRRHGLFRGLMAWLALFVIAYPMAIILSKPLFGGQPDVATSPLLEVSDFNSRPDIVIVVLDAYGGRSVLAETYGFDNSPFLAALEQRGFEAPGETIANYGRTQLSIPTVLQLDYVSDEGELSDADLQSLLGVLGGRSRLATALRAQGYRTVQVESGWLGSRCASIVDVCVRAPWPDETFYDAINRSVLVGLPGFEQGRPFTVGALSATDWLLNEMPLLLADDQPDFVFAHVLLPHPPLFLNSHCEPDWRGGLDGFAIGEMGYTEEDVERARRLYVQQVECANRILLELADLLGDEDVALLMGDHGPDSGAQLFMQSEDWTEVQRTERFEAFLAAKVPGCSMADIQSLVNVGRRLLACLSGDSFPDLPTRTFDIHKTAEQNTVIELEVPSGLTFGVTG